MLAVVTELFLDSSSSFLVGSCPNGTILIVGRSEPGTQVDLVARKQISKDLSPQELFRLAISTTIVGLLDCARNTLDECIMTNDDFQNHLDKHPDDWSFRLAYADWLENQPSVFCQTQRWMVNNRKHPVCNGFWNWRSDENREFDIGGLFNFLRRGRLSARRKPPFFREYLTRQVAELDLHEALLKSGEIQE